MSAAVRFAGYAAIFDRIDNGGDMIRPGAFAASLRRSGAAALPLLWQHRADRVIGRIEQVAEDVRGLRVIGTVEGEAAAALRAGTVAGLSFGYRVVAAQGERPRRLDTLDLVEISLVTHPMQPLARVHALA